MSESSLIQILEEARRRAQQLNRWPHEEKPALFQSGEIIDLMNQALDIIRQHEGNKQTEFVSIAEEDANKPSEISVMTGTEARNAELEALTADSLCNDLLAACNGHPHAKIKWPHYLLHNAVYFIQKQQRLLARESSTQEKLPAAHDIIIQAINEYTGYMLDDDYDADRMLNKIMNTMKDRAKLHGIINEIEGA